MWATAGSLSELETMIDDAVRRQNGWALAELYSMDRVAYDERPDELADLSPRRRSAEVHLVAIAPHGEAPGPGHG